MKHRRLLWQILPSYFAVVLLSLGAVAWYALRTVHALYVQRLEADLRAKAALVADRLTSEPAADADALCKRLGSLVGARFTVIRPSGQVIGDSQSDPAVMDNHADRPEIATAMRGEVGSSTRFSDTLRQNMMYLGYPVLHEGRSAMVVRVALPLTHVEAALRAVSGRVGQSAVLILVGALALSIVMARRVTRPIEDLKAGAERFAGGDLAYRLHVPASEEISRLAEAMNAMAGQLQERIATVVRQQSELGAVFASMVEGVFAVDERKRVLRANAAARALLGTNGGDVEGRLIEEIVRNADLFDFIERALRSDVPAEADIVLHEGGDRYLQAHGSALRDVDGRRIGALIVLHDVTRLRRLEGVRRDFVANVSHELKTPITAIKGFVESLLDGAADNPAQRERFLSIIARQTDNMNAIIADLLSLARLEHDTESRRIELERMPLAGVLAEAVEICHDRAARKQIEVHVDCEPALAADLNASLFEQAVVNLVDNAIKYSPEGTAVRVSGVCAGGEVVVTVRDEGCGIEAAHLERIFERFYRVDKGRSRQMGGTGLGLAIVKHIAGFHGGRVSVTSAPGKGSAFAIHLPAVG